MNLFQSRRGWIVRCLPIYDIICLFVSNSLAYYFSLQKNPILLILIPIVLFVTLLVAFDGYNFVIRYALFQQAGLLALISLQCFIFMGFLKFSFSMTNGTQLWLQALSLFVATFLLLVGRKVFLWLLNHKTICERVLVFGNGWMAQAIAKALKERRPMGWVFVGFVTEKSSRTQKNMDNFVLGNLDDLEKIIGDYSVTIIADARKQNIDLNPGRHGDSNYDKGGDLKNEFSTMIIDGQDFHEALTRRIPIPEEKNEHNKLDIHIVAKPRLHQYIRHAYNILFALVFLFASIPIWAAICIAIKLYDGGPIFYVGPRIGYLGRTFNLIKFRTMMKTADDLISREGYLPDDCITKIGRYIRKTRMDELPQLLNVLKRDINFVGPRPFVHREEMCFRNEIPYFEKRYMVRPGITGMAQVLYRYENTIEDAKTKLQYDLYYVKNSGFFLDLLILLWTMVSILSFKGK